MSRQFKVRLSGNGGQGLILAAVILAEAAARAGLNVAQTQSYGPEARGGASKSEVIISREDIDFPKITHPDAVLTMSEQAFKKYGLTCGNGCVLLVDTTNVTDTSANPGAVCLPITRFAKEHLGKTIVANIVALGALNALTDAVKYSTLQEVVLERAPTGTEEINLKALKLGHSMAKKIM